MAKTPTGLCCGYCGGALPPDPSTITTTRPDRRNPRLRHEVVSVALCEDCRSLTRYACRSVWVAIIGAQIAAPYTDSQLHKAGAAVIRPLFENQTNVSGPRLPWSHISLADARIALAALDIDKFTRDPKHPHKSGLNCGSCGVIESGEWLPTMISGWPCCADCTGFLSGDFGQGKRVRSLFGTELKHSTSTPHVGGDVLRPFAATDAEPTSQRWGFVSEADRERLRRHLVEIGYPLCPDSWVTKYGKPKATTAPAPKPEKVGAVGSAV